MRVLKARAVAGGYRFQVHLDEAMVDADGRPAPEWLREFTVGPAPDGESADAYVERMLGEVRAICMQDMQMGAAVADEGVALAQEGARI